MTRRGAAPLACLVGPALLLAGGTLRAQTVDVRGRVVTAAGDPVPSADVALHRVTAAGGGRIDRLDTGPDGRFEFRIGPDADSAVFFAATRYEGELYVGTPFRLTDPPQSEYLIAVGPGAARVLDLGPAVPAGAASPSPPSWRLAGLAALLAAVVVTALAIASRRRGARSYRELLLRIAALDERFAAREAAADDAARDAYRRKRAELRDRLAAHPSRAFR